MAATYVQGNKNQGSGTSLTVALTGVAAGNLIVLHFSWAGWANITSVSDGTTALTGLTEAATGSRRAQLYDLLSANSGNKTYTVTLDAAASDLMIWVMEFSGGTWTFDAESSYAEAATTASTSGDITTTGTDGVVVNGTRLYDFAADTSNPLINGVTPTEPAWSPIETYHHQYYRILTASFTGGSADLTYSTSTLWTNCIAAFKIAAGGGLSIPVATHHYKQQGMQ